uniref:Large ribosomal subunit protein eL24 n=1 Tax=Eptatretus burgeri TaxID=7764 RepID=A0A8C4RAR6_EPTBU
MFCIILYTAQYLVLLNLIYTSAKSIIIIMLPFAVGSSSGSSFTGAIFVGTVTMKLELCNFSGYKVYPGHGKRYARTDCKVFNFLNSKAQSLFLSRRNPRQISWTVLYRRKHRKGQQDEVSKRRVRKSAKVQKTIVGMALTDILAKRNQKPEVRKAQREQAIRAAKEVKKAKAASKKPIPVKVQQKSQKQRIAKPMKMQAPRVGGKR